MAKTNYVAYLDALTDLGWNRRRRKDLPVVVGIIVGVASYLLSLRRDTSILVSEWVAVWVAVKVDLGLLVADGDGIVVIDANRLKAHDIVAQGFLELWSHKIVTRSRTSKNGEMNLEPEEVEEEGHDKQADKTSNKVLAKLD
jgi:hypothetical protein